MLYLKFSLIPQSTVARLLLVFALLLVLALAWHLRNAGWVQAFTQPVATAPAAIVFDKGPAPQAAGASSPAATAQPGSRSTGALRKCKRGGETLYTNSDCPPGSTVLSADRGTVTVINDQSASLARHQLEAAKPQVLEPDLKEKLIQRAVGH